MRVQIGIRDLGVLRERVRICTEGIALMAPKAKVLKADENPPRHD
jgi:hypothetical protein